MVASAEFQAAPAGRFAGAGGAVDHLAIHLLQLVPITPATRGAGVLARSGQHLVPQMVDAIERSAHVAGVLVAARRA